MKIVETCGTIGTECRSPWYPRYRPVTRRLRQCSLDAHEDVGAYFGRLLEVVVVQEGTALAFALTFALAFAASSSTSFAFVIFALAFPGRVCVATAGLDVLW